MNAALLPLHCWCQRYATTVADHATSVWWVVTTMLFNHPCSDTRVQWECRQAIPGMACAQGSTSLCIAALASLRAYIDSCPSRGHAHRDSPATLVADRASSVWSVVTTLLFNLLCADPSGQRESCMAFSLKSLRNGKHLALHCSAGSPARRHRQLSSRGHARLDSLATSVADRASSVRSVVTISLFNHLCAGPLGQ